MNSSGVSGESKANSLDHLLAALLERIRTEVALEAVQAAAPCDLDSGGFYVEGHLVLAPGRLGYFSCHDGRWDAKWLATDTITEAKIVEGLGVHSLRLLTDGKITEEFRFTLRHARQVAKLRRRLKRNISPGQV